MNQQQQIDQYCRRYKIMGVAAQLEETTLEAQQEQVSYTTFLLRLFEKEGQHRDVQARGRDSSKWPDYLKNQTFRNMRNGRAAV